MEDTATIEEQRMARLQQARLAAQAVAGSPVAKAKLALSFGKKISHHWLILIAAVFVDLTFGWIPILCVIFDWLFALGLFVYFGPKSRGGSEFLKIGLPMLGGSIIDFIFSIFTPCVAATLIRIALSENENK